MKDVAPSDAGMPWPSVARWGICFAGALVLHGAGAWTILAHRPDAVAMPSGPVVMVELAPVPVAPAAPPSVLPTGPQQVQTEPAPDPVEEKVVTLAPEPDPEPVAQVDPLPAPAAELPPPLPKPQVKPVERKRETKKKRQRQIATTTAPSTAEEHTEQAAAPVEGQSANSSDLMPSWKSLLLAQLERHKRYPSAAQSRGEAGTAMVAFAIDRSGHVHGARIVRSSGAALLDEETLALVQRAQPLPPPPADVRGSAIPIVVPIRYSIR